MTDTRWTDEADFLVDVPISSFSNRPGSCWDEVLQWQSSHVHCMKILDFEECPGKKKL